MSALRRKSNWPAALELFLAEKAGQRFDWETNNCGFFACDWIAMLVGVDPAAPFRDEIVSALTAARVLEREGGIEAIAAAAAQRWGWPEVPVKRARRGDIVSIDAEGGPALSVCIGGDCVVSARGKAGLLKFPVLSARRAWQIA